MNNFIDKLPRSAVAVALAAALIMPAAVFANNDNSHGKNEVKTTNTSASVEINVNGSANVKNAKVTGVNGSTITATTQWGSNTLTWTVLTDGSTNFLYKGGKSAALSTVVAGDTINFNGALASSSGLTVQAKNVRDLSKEKVVAEKHVFEGKLSAAIGTTSLPTTFGLTIGSTNYTVKVPSGTPILSKNWASVNLGSFVAGDSVRVYGSADASTTNTINAVVVRDATR